MTPVVRYHVTFASGEHLTVLASSATQAVQQAERLRTGDAVVEVRLW